ncbi:MAG TPA: hypothetical protein VG435_00760 [Acidimicrobiales bacterium]|jgi:hypothetical protein|nr:hypothetical protein [Acidimicrobiales bacterium]
MSKDSASIGLSSRRARNCGIQLGTRSERFGRFDDGLQGVSDHAVPAFGGVLVALGGRRRRVAE